MRAFHKGDEPGARRRESIETAEREVAEHLAALRPELLVADRSRLTCETYQFSVITNF